FAGLHEKAGSLEQGAEGLVAEEAEVLVQLDDGERRHDSELQAERRRIDVQGQPERPRPSGPSHRSPARVLFWPLHQARPLQGHFGVDPLLAGWRADLLLEIEQEPDWIRLV